MTARTDPYDALLIVSFGGPEGPDDVLPFLRNVTRGRGVPEERLAEVGEHYAHFGGVSPINSQNRELLAAVRSSFAQRSIDVPVYWGNRNWAPYLSDALEQMHHDGVRRAAAFVTSAYPSYSGCRQYRENLADAAAQNSLSDIRIDKLRHYYNVPGFIEPMVRSTIAALEQMPQPLRRTAGLTFTTHSIPTAQAEASGPAGGAYVGAHQLAASLVAAGVMRHTGNSHPFRVVYQSRSGPPSVPWLEPDVNDFLRELAEQNVTATVLVPIGFVSDHVEVLYDLDVEAAKTAADLGMVVTRAATVGTAPEFVDMIGDLLLERAAAERGEQPPRAAEASSEASHDVCPRTCCPNLRGPRPALAETA